MDIIEKQYIINLIKNLIKQYIQIKSLINLLVIPITNNLANSSILKLIKELKAKYCTIGYLIKPNYLQEVKLLKWKESILQVY